MTYNLRLIATLANYLWRLWLIVLATAVFIPLFPAVYALAFSKKHYKYCYFFIRLWCIIVFYGMGFRYKTMTNKQLEKNKQYVVIANHTSLMDVLLMVVIHKKNPVIFVGKKELEKIPLFGAVYRNFCILVDRKDPQSRANVYVQAEEKLREGKSIAIFPEGGVKDYPTEILEPFKDGAFNIAVQNGVPLAVYTFTGLREMFPFLAGKGCPGIVKVFLNEIIPPEYDKNHIKNYAFNLIKQTLENKKNDF